MQQVARGVFGTEGLAASFDEIARHARLGVGTIYRHLPARQTLFDATVVGHVEQLVREGRADVR